MAIKFKGIGHVALRTKDYDKVEKFYTDVLELKKAFDLKTEDGTVWITYYKLPSGQFVEFFPRPIPGFEEVDNKYVGDNRQPDRSHFHCCFEIDARHEAYRDMAKKGINITHDAEDGVGMCGSWCSFVDDPEGNQWELMEFSPVSKQIAMEPQTLNFKGYEEE